MTRMYRLKNKKNGENTTNFPKIEKTKNLGSRECYKEGSCLPHKKKVNGKHAKIILINT